MSEIKPVGYLYWSLIEPHWLPMNFTWDQSVYVYQLQFDALPEGIGYLYAGHWCQSEVRNGGLEQFFYNTTGLLAPEALAAYRTIGIKPWAEVLSEAMGFFGRTYPRDRAKRMKLLAKSQQPFNKLDDRFYEWLKGDFERWSRTADEFAKRLSAEQLAADES
jgi:hypothetical protein